MIYEATTSESLDEAARSAAKEKCNKFLHGNRLYEVELKYNGTDLHLGRKPAPAPKLPVEDASQSMVGVNGRS